MKRLNQSLLLLSLGLGALGCTSTIHFEGKTSIPITGEARPPRMSKRALKAALKNRRIEIAEKVQFELDKAIIKPESHGLLNDVAQVIKDNPQVKRVNIEGHASADGDDAHNMKLSDDRAKAVRDYLVSQGIDGSRLVSQGYGETRPVGDNNTADGREKNRRVEFHTEEGPTSNIPSPAQPIKK